MFVARNFDIFNMPDRYLVCGIVHLDYIPINNINTQNKFVYWLVYCLSDGLWYLALLLIQYNVLLENSIYSRVCTTSQKY